MPKRSKSDSTIVKKTYDANLKSLRMRTKDWAGLGKHAEQSTEMQELLQLNPHYELLPDLVIRAQNKEYHKAALQPLQLKLNPYRIGRETDDAKTELLNIVKDFNPPASSASATSPADDLQKKKTAFVEHFNEKLTHAVSADVNNLIHQLRQSIAYEIFLHQISDSNPYPTKKAERKDYATQWVQDDVNAWRKFSLNEASQAVIRQAQQTIRNDLNEDRAPFTQIHSAISEDGYNFTSFVTACRGMDSILEEKSLDEEFTNEYKYEVPSILKDGVFKTIEKHAYKQYLSPVYQDLMDIYENYGREASNIAWLSWHADELTDKELATLYKTYHIQLPLEQQSVFNDQNINWVLENFEKFSVPDVNSFYNAYHQLLPDTSKNLTDANEQKKQIPIICRALLLSCMHNICQLMWLDKMGRCLDQLEVLEEEYKDENNLINKNIIKKAVDNLPPKADLNDKTTWDNVTKQYINENKTELIARWQEDLKTAESFAGMTHEEQALMRKAQNFYTKWSVEVPREAKRDKYSGALISNDDDAHIMPGSRRIQLMNPLTGTLFTIYQNDRGDLHVETRNPAGWYRRAFSRLDRFLTGYNSEVQREEAAIKKLNKSNEPLISPFEEFARKFKPTPPSAAGNVGSIFSSVLKAPDGKEIEFDPLASDALFLKQYLHYHGGIPRILNFQSDNSKNKTAYQNVFQSDAVGQKSADENVSKQSIEKMKQVQKAESEGKYFVHPRLVEKYVENLTENELTETDKEQIALLKRNLHPEGYRCDTETGEIIKVERAAVLDITANPINVNIEDDEMDDAPTITAKPK